MNVHTLYHQFKPSKTMPIDVGIIHFVGIGGIGMSGIAEILHNLGYQVSGSDMSENVNVTRLKEMEITIHIGHDAEHVEEAAVVVRSTAVPMTNPEIIAARERHIPVVRRAEMLAELMRLKTSIAIAGTHGKTTTTSLVGSLLESADLEPTVINGGIINAYGTNAHLGSGEWLVAEADESDGTFLKIPSAVGVITNIDPEHLNYWGSFDAMRDAFRSFIENLPFYGFAVLCKDNKEVRTLMSRITDRRVISYGIEEESDIMAVNIRSSVDGSRFDVVISKRLTGKNDICMKEIHLAMPGEHNVLNALAAIGVAYELNVDESHIRSALHEFTGVKRRFTKTGESNGVTIIDDYGHHPTEILATLKAGRSVLEGTDGKLVAVVQPHRYSRLESLFQEFSECFCDADIVLVSDVYAAGESPIEGVDKEALVARLKERGVRAYTLESEEELPQRISELAHKGDMVICLGAGSVTNWAAELPEKLQALHTKRKRA